jgi:hypothetical protein
MARAYRRARPTPRSQEPAGWLASLSESDRTGFRRRGMELVGNLLTYLDAGRDREHALFGVADRNAHDYGAEAAKAGASLSDAVEGFLRFRRPFVDELALLARRRHLDTREATELLADAESALDRLLISLMLGHKSSSAHE